MRPSIERRFAAARAAASRLAALMEIVVVPVKIRSFPGPSFLNTGTPLMRWVSALGDSPKLLGLTAQISKFSTWRGVEQPLSVVPGGGSQLP